MPLLYLKKMIDTIYDMMKEAARQHRLIRGFKFGAVTRSLGCGEDAYPLLFLEDNITTSGRIDGGLVTAALNFQVLALPRGEGLDQEAEALCERVAREILLRIRTQRPETGVNLLDWSALAVSFWYDDASAGVRVSCRVTLPADINPCVLDEVFDPEGSLDVLDSAYTPIGTDGAEGCGGPLAPPTLKKRIM